MKETTFADQVMHFNERLSKIKITLPPSYQIINPFEGSNEKQVKTISKSFYSKFYNDDNKRIMILGSSPARRGTAVTGVPFEDSQHLQKQTGITIDGFYINKSSSNFLYDVINQFGGCDKFYAKYYLNFVCPLGVVHLNEKGHEINCNYYDNKQLRQALCDFIISSLKEQLKFNIDTSVCYCIGSGENFKFLQSINEQYKFFNKIIPLEHPRFIMQYNSKDKDKFLNKYLNVLKFGGIDYDKK